MVSCENVDRRRADGEADAGRRRRIAGIGNHAADRTAGVRVEIQTRRGGRLVDHDRRRARRVHAWIVGVHHERAFAGTADVVVRREV